MDKTLFYQILDIDKPSDFKYYENFASLIESDEYFDEELLEELFFQVDKQTLIELTDSFFDEFLQDVPENESDFYFLCENIKQQIMGKLSPDMDESEVSDFVQEICTFKSWYLREGLVINHIDNTDYSIRDARYELKSAELLEDDLNLDFGLALDYDLTGYDISLNDLMMRSFDD